MGFSDELMRMKRLRDWSPGEAVQPTRWRPATDVYRVPGGWLVKLELAGVREHELELGVRGHSLLVRGRRCDMEWTEGCEFYSMEIAYSQFERAIELPCNLETANIVKEYRHGMLLLRIFTEGSQP